MYFYSGSYRSNTFTIKNSLITKNNIVDNAYGVYNVEADGTTASAVPVPAPANWWGLRFTPPTPNTGPAVSPTTNPPVPENPVNSAVDFLPFRSGAQSDPQSGQYTNIQAPMPVTPRTAKSSSIPVDPPCPPNICLNVRVVNIHSCNAIPPTPSGFFKS